MSSYTCTALTHSFRLFRDHHRYATPDLQGRSRHWKLQLVGSILRVRLDRLLSPHQVRLIFLIHIQEERYLIRDPIWLRKP